MLEINLNGFTRCETLFTLNNIAIIRSFIYGRGAAAVVFFYLPTSSYHRIPRIIEAWDRKHFKRLYG